MRSYVTYEVEALLLRAADAVQRVAADDPDANFPRDIPIAAYVARLQVHALSFGLVTEHRLQMFAEVLWIDRNPTPKQVGCFSVSIGFRLSLFSYFFVFPSAAIKKAGKEENPKELCGAPADPCQGKPKVRLRHRSTVDGRMDPCGSWLSKNVWIDRCVSPPKLM